MDAEYTNTFYNINQYQAYDWIPIQHMNIHDVNMSNHYYKEPLRKSKKV